MAYRGLRSWGVGGSLLVFASALVAACNNAVPESERIGTAESALWTNGGFESSTAGAAPGAPWTVVTNINNGITVQTPQTFAGLNLQPGGVAKTVILNAPGGPGSQTDADLGATASLRWPRYGNQVALVNQHGNLQNVNILSQTMTVAAGDVDPFDGQIHIRFTVAPVLQNPLHTAAQQPYYFINLTDNTKGTTLYQDFNLSGAGIPWKTETVGGVQVDYTDWQLVDVSGAGAKIAVGDSVTVQIIGSGCQPNGHWGEVYVDGVGSVVPGLNITGTAPAEVNAGANLTYTLTYKNGSATGETGVVMSFVTPGTTTFVSTATPVGLTCVPVTVTGVTTVTCSLAGTLAAGANGSFTVTVNVPAGTAHGSTITEANYQIQSTQETALLGPPISTLVGCTADAQCPAGNWCDESIFVCSPTLPNGTALPTDPPHTNPTLNGTCAAVGASALVCTSKVCDTDNKCGYLNGDGSCTAVTGPVVCRSAVCDPDGKCGYANGDGPCTSGTGATVCRSGVCSTNLLCEPVGGCNVDADCTGGKWCAEATHTCTPKLTNGTVVPTDPPHSNPTLNGTCTAQVGTLVCISGVCDTHDNDCGYAVGDGPCVPGPAGNGGTVCRSGACSTNGTCEPLGGCDVDADCTGGNWCDESLHTCSPKLGNGVTIPSDPPHTNPILNATCSAQAGALVCVSGVCDTHDNKCGYANGDGPCTVVTGGVVCRSGACSVNGLCEPSGGCNIDADCTGGNWCAEATHTCTAPIPNGGPVPTDPPHTNPILNGTCTAAAGALTCVSKVCDPADNDCGYANGDGPCVPGSSLVCRSGSCSVSGTCEPAGGCNVDGDCTAGNWCNETAHMCVPQIPNGNPVPTDPGHTNPTLNGTCSPQVGVLTCVSGVCDVHDNDCGYANGDGPCNAVNGGVVCRSGTCSTNGTCEPMGGCNVDADCTTGNWCNESVHQCTPQLPNGTPVPTDPGHSPTLNGTCTLAAGTLTCVSGVCDTNDNECGYANGDGPCNPLNGGIVCRSGACSTNGTCEPASGCNVDADCTTGNWCNESMHQCTPQLPNGTTLPTDGPHTNPTLNGMCTPAAATVVCVSGVCDTDNKCGYANGDGPCGDTPGVCRSNVCDPDNKCGYANGDGPCTGTNGGTVCRSTICTTTGPNAGLCEQCNGDGMCASPTPACSATTNKCVQCTSTNGTACTGKTPLCNTSTDTCVPCNGDNGQTGSTEDCGATNPYCNLSGTNAGACGKCMTNTDCTGHSLGPVCDPTSGACGMGCFQDTDCNTATQWCNAPTGGSGSCVPKLTNGTPLPGTPVTVSTCSTTVGARVCLSGACDPKDNKCGYQNGDGPCNGMPAECRSGACDKDGNCGYANGDGPCASPGQCRSDICNGTMVCVACATDNDCPMGDFCSPTGACLPKEGNGQACGNADMCIVDICATDGQCGLPNGQTCMSPSQCRTNLCTNGTCGPATTPTPTPVNDAGSLEGGGCSVGGGGSGTSDGLLGLGILAVGAAFARGRRRSR